MKNPFVTVNMYSEELKQNQSHLQRQAWGITLAVLVLDIVILFLSIGIKL